MEFGPILRAMTRSKVRYGLIVLEVALTLAVVTNCVSLIRDAQTQLGKESGFDDANILVVRSQPFAPAFQETGYLSNSVRQDLDVLGKIPGVKAVSNTRFLPWQGGGSSTETRPAGSKGPWLRNQIYNADEGTFATLGSPVVEGRGFTRGEVEAEDARLAALLANSRERGEDGTPKNKISQDVVISRAFARLAFGDGSPLGKRLEDSDGDQYHVVGVIDRFYNPYGWPIHEYAMFYPSSSATYAGGSAYLLRTEPGALETVAAAAEKSLLAANGGRNLRVRTLDEVKRGFQAPQRLVLGVLSGVIVLLLFVTSLGIIGLTSFSVAERTRQIGTRRALGAQRSDILRYFLLENWIVTTLGLSLGVLLAVALNVILVNQLRAHRMDGSYLAGGVLLLWAAGLLATWLPALRGARVAPAIATRNV
ncbi:MAG: FtsX-like permease family protein [Acidobacteriota bacterium]